MVEVYGCGVNAEPSQGTHFFQNITSLGIPYLMVEDTDCKESPVKEKIRGIHWDWLNELEPLQDLQYVSHIRLPRPFILKVNGQASEAVGYYPDEE